MGGQSGSLCFVGVEAYFITRGIAHALTLGPVSCSQHSSSHNQANQLSPRLVTADVSGVCRWSPRCLPFRWPVLFLIIDLTLWQWVDPRHLRWKMVVRLVP
jgi:hypothetical protein